jgi:hypothetical protein
VAIGSTRHHHRRVYVLNLVIELLDLVCHVRLLSDRARRFGPDTVAGANSGPECGVGAALSLRKTKGAGFPPRLSHPVAVPPEPRGRAAV